MIIFTAVIAGTGIIGAIIFAGQLRVMYRQLKEMERSSKQTETIAKAAQDSANAAANSVKIAERTLNENIEASRLEQRAWISLGNMKMITFEENKPIKLEVTFKNRKDLCTEC